MFRQAGRADLFFESGPPGAVAYQQKSNSRTATHEFRREGKQVIVTFEFEEPSDFSDDEAVGFEFPTSAKLEVIFCR